MKIALGVFTFFIHTVCVAAVVPSAPQISSECEAYLKKVQAQPIADSKVLPSLGFPAEALIASSPAPLEPKPSRDLILKKDDPPSKQPFWKTKPGLQDRMERDRQVLTSVTRTETPNDEVKFDMKVAGLASAPRDFAFKTSQNFDRLKEAADNFKTVHYRASDHHLFMVISALGYQERMILEVFPASGEGRDEIQFEIVWGNLKGMKGYIGFESFSLTKTEVSLVASYQAKTLPLPKIFMGLALEVVTQKVAEKLRNFLESDYKQALKCGAL